MREEVYKFPTEYTTKTSISHSSLDPHFTGRGSLLHCNPQKTKANSAWSKVWGCFYLKCQRQGRRVHHVGLKRVSPFPVLCPCFAPGTVAVISTRAAQSQREC